jgi:hypothetical protein
MAAIIKSKIYNFKKNDVLYDIGDEITKHAVGLLKEGKAEIIYKLKNEKSLNIVISKFGFLGILESVSNEDYRISKVKFLEDSKMYFWNKEEFILDSSINPELGMKAIGFLSAFLRTINKKIQEVG